MNQKTLIKGLRKLIRDPTLHLETLKKVIGVFQSACSLNNESDKRFLSELSKLMEIWKKIAKDLEEMSKMEEEIERLKKES